MPRETTYDHREMLTDIRDSIDRYLRQGPTPPPVEACPTSSEVITIDKSGVYKDCVLSGQIDITAPDVTLQNVVLEGTNPHYTLLTAAKGTKLEGCTLIGSPYGQHRGIRVDAPGIRLLNTKVLNIWSTIVSDAQAVAGWDGCKDLVIDGGEYWATTENMIFGGSPCPEEANIPQDILIQNLLMDKELIWKNRQHGTVKNIFELKNAKRLKMKNVTMRHSWGHGQGGEAVVLTVRQEYPNQSPHNRIEDITLEDIKIENVGSGFNLLGRDTYGPITEHVMKNILLKNIDVKGFDRHAWDGNGQQFQIGLGTENLTIDNVQFKGGPKEAYYTIISFYGYEQGVPYENKNLVIRRSTFNEGQYSVHAAGATVGGVIPALDLYAPGWVWEDVVVEDQSGEYVYP